MLHSSSGITVFTETSRTAILHEEILQDSSSSNFSSNSSSNATRAHYTTIQRILHPESNSTYRRQRALRVLLLHTEGKGPSFQKRNSTHRRQGDLLEMHPCVLQDIPGNSSCSRVIHDLPASPGNSTMFQYLQGIHPIPAFYSSIGFHRKLHRVPVGQLQTLQTFIHSSKKGRCCDIGQIDIFFRIELFPLSSLSSDNTNCKNDIPLFHQLFDELSVYRDYH